MRAWTTRERRRAARYLMWHAFIEIRYLARAPKGKEDPATALERIGLLADACHNLPGEGRAPRRGDPDPFMGPWKSVTTGQHAWMASVLKSASLDTAWLDAAPVWPPTVTPADRPRLAWGGFRFPRSLREYAALDTNALRALLVDATEFGCPTSGEPDDLLRHTAADGTHLLRAIRPGEMLFEPHHEGLAEYRCLMEMDDGSVVVDRLWLRPTSFAAQPRRLSLARNLWLAASVKQRHERDTYLWRRDHDASAPACPLCTSRPTPQQ